MLRLLIFMGIQVAIAVPGLLFRTRLPRALWVAGLVIGNLVFASGVSTSQVRADVKLIVLAQRSCGEGDVAPLRDDLVRIARAGAAMQIGLTLGLAVLAAFPLRRSPGSKECGQHRVSGETAI